MEDGDCDFVERFCVDVCVSDDILFVYVCTSNEMRWNVCESES